MLMSRARRIVQRFENIYTLVGNIAILKLSSLTWFNKNLLQVQHINKFLIPKQQHWHCKTHDDEQLLVDNAQLSPTALFPHYLVVSSK